CKSVICGETSPSKLQACLRSHTIRASQKMNCFSVLFVRFVPRISVSYTRPRFSNDYHSDAIQTSHLHTPSNDYTKHLHTPSNLERKASDVHRIASTSAKRTTHPNVDPEVFQMRHQLGTLYSTSNLYFHNVYKIQKAIQRHMLNHDAIVSGMAKDMKTKFDKYWETYTMVLSFGAILDPRYKLNIIEFYLSELGMEGPLLIEKVQSVENGLRKLYSAYEIQPNVMQGSTKGPSSNVGGGKLCDDAEDDLAGFETFQSQYKILEVQKSQLDQYLDEPKLDKNQKIDILQFWKENQVRYPELAIMARDILSIPITTVASESTFSIGGRIISKYRSSLCSSNAEALLCTRDWIFDLKDEDEVDEKELIDEDIAKLVRSSSKSVFHLAYAYCYAISSCFDHHCLAADSAEVRAAEEKKEDKEESDDNMILAH
ncbi:zinc finger BED domain-containing protein RICESLEEPER 2-like protein, partial [Tanacetum coccineum]